MIQQVARRERLLCGERFAFCSLVLSHIFRFCTEPLPSYTCGDCCCGGAVIRPPLLLRGSRTQPEHGSMDWRVSQGEEKANTGPKTPPFQTAEGWGTRNVEASERAVPPA